MSKHTKFRSLMSILYALIILLPLSSVGFRCAYTIFNKNAYESYYGETINQENYIPISFNELKTGKEYHFINNNLLNVTETNGYYRLWVENVSIYNSTTDYSLTNNLRFYSYPSTNATAMVVSLYNNNSLITSVTVSQTYTNITFTLLEKTSTDITNFTQFFNNIYEIQYNKYSYLDNAFEYSLHEFVGNNGRGVLNLTDWFTSVFLQSSTHTQLYLDFINWYMNYTLLVSCVYILYLVLMWFVSLARRLLTNMIEKGGELK